MNRCFSDLGRCISILDRLMKMYYDHGLSNFEIGYIRIVRSEDDRCIRRLYLTDKAVLAAQRIKGIHNSFYNTLCAGIAPEDIQHTEQIMEQMMKNVNRKVWHRMEDYHGE